MPPPFRLVLALPPLAAALVLTGCSSSEPAASPEPAVTASVTASPPAAPSRSPSSLPTVLPGVTTAPNPSGGSVPPVQPPPATTRPPVETAPPPGQPLCKAADLTLTDADAVITADSVQELFVVRTSGPDCQLQGYPEVVLKGPGGAALTVAYTRGGGGLDTEKPGVVTLSRSTSLSFQVATPRTGGCTSAASVSARLPGTDGDLTATTSLSVCQSKAGVSPLGRIRADS